MNITTWQYGVKNYVSSSFSELIDSFDNESQQIVRALSPIEL